MMKSNNLNKVSLGKFIPLKGKKWNHLILITIFLIMKVYRLEKMFSNRLYIYLLPQRCYIIWSRQKLNSVKEVVSKLLNLSANITMK